MASPFESVNSHTISYLIFQIAFFVFVRVASWCYDVAHLLPIRYDHNYPRVLRVLNVLRALNVLMVTRVLKVLSVPRVMSSASQLFCPLITLMPLLPFCGCANRGVA